MSSFSILPEWNHEQQREHVKSYIEANLVKTGLETDDLSILPITAIKELATYSNIRLVVGKAPDDELSTLPEHSRDYLATKFLENCPQQFAACMYAQTSLLFLRELWNYRLVDAKLPLPAYLDIGAKFAEQYKVHCNIQEKFCAPVFTLGDFDRGVLDLRIMPWTETTHNGDEGSITMSFHQAHIVDKEGNEPGSYTGNLEFQLIVYKSKEVATMYPEVWSKGKFGFMCKNGYYLLYI